LRTKSISYYLLTVPGIVFFHLTRCFFVQCLAPPTLGFRHHGHLPCPFAPVYVEKLRPPPRSPPPFRSLHCDSGMRQRRTLSKSFSGYVLEPQSPPNAVLTPSDNTISFPVGIPFLIFLFTVIHVMRSSVCSIPPFPPFAGKTRVALR